MGLDLPNLRLVVYRQHPATVADHLQEFGRGGRDCAPAVAVSFTGSSDTGLHKYTADVTVSVQLSTLRPSLLRVAGRTPGFKTCRSARQHRVIVFERP